MGELEFIFVSYGACCLFIQSEGSLSLHANQEAVIKEIGSCAV